jgi:hypothetical protein
VGQSMCRYLAGSSWLRGLLGAVEPNFGAGGVAQVNGAPLGLRLRGNDRSFASRRDADVPGKQKRAGWKGRYIELRDGVLWVTLASKASG